jgi:uncharacterized protein (TIGR02145 family)
MADNLNVDTFQNGAKIIQVTSTDEWFEAKLNNVPAWCYHDFNPNNEFKFGKLYNIHAVNDPRGLAPKGWRISTDKDWKLLVKYLGGLNIAGEKLKSKSYWIAKGNGNNFSGFNGIPGGYCDFDGSFSTPGTYGGWWRQSNEYGAGAAYLSSSDSKYGPRLEEYPLNKEPYWSVRCLRNN